jgi:hypothetical protein
MHGEVRVLGQYLGLETLQMRGESDVSIPPKNSGRLQRAIFGTQKPGVALFSCDTSLSALSLFRPDWLRLATAPIRLAGRSDLARSPV